MASRTFSPVETYSPVPTETTGARSCWSVRRSEYLEFTANTISLLHDALYTLLRLNCKRPGPPRAPE
jgi:hypothetical protein